MRFLAVGLVASLVLGALFVVPARTQTESLTDEEIALVQANCQTVKNTLNQLHASDALLRVNRGQAYESILTKLMERFNSRMASNGLDNKAMLTVTDDYRDSLTDFRYDYQMYEEQLAATIKMDCQAHPEEFHFAIEDAREKRAQVHSDVQALYRAMEDYDSVIDDFMLNYKMGEAR